MKTEAKVGAFTLAGLLLLAALVIGLSGFSLRSGKGYTPGVMGEKFVNIQPAEDRGYYISDGAYLIGEDEAAWIRCSRVSTRRWARCRNCSRA